MCHGSTVGITLKLLLIKSCPMETTELQPKKTFWKTFVVAWDA